ncbi:MAG: hypothetical protein LBL08_03000 [Candidatus Nomurabacteria bacterium]|nr:hypothetical protein [Candidatus Nomurabacteria bacterium]
MSGIAIFLPIIFFVSLTIYLLAESRRNNNWLWGVSLTLSMVASWGLVFAISLWFVFLAIPATIYCLGRFFAKYLEHYIYDSDDDLVADDDIRDNAPDDWCVYNPDDSDHEP